MISQWPALVLSLTVFPGSGHFYIKRKLRGIFWSGLTLVLLAIALVLFEGELVTQTKSYLSQHSQLSIGSVLFQTWQAQKGNLLPLIGGLIFTWLGSCVDLLWIGRNKKINSNNA